MDEDLIKGYLHPLAPIPTALKPKGRLRMPVRCLVCDLYGTLFISASGDVGTSFESDRQTAFIDLLLARYGQTKTPQDLLTQLRRHIDAAHERLQAKGVQHPEVVIEDIWAQLLPDMDSQTRRHFAVEFEMINNPVWPMPGVNQLLSACRENGIRLGIISNAQFYTPHLFSWLLGRNAASLGFDPNLTLYSFQLGQAKPAVELFETIRQRLNEAGIPSQAVAYIGNDMRNDVVPAHAAGFQTILFAGDKRSLRMRNEDPQCQSIHPDMVVTQLDQLASYLQ